MNAALADTPQSQTSELCTTIVSFLVCWDDLRSTVSPEYLFGLDDLWHHHQARDAAWSHYRTADRKLHAAARDLVLAPFGLRLALTDFLVAWDSQAAHSDAGLTLKLARQHLRETVNPYLHSPDLLTL